MATAIEGSSQTNTHHTKDEHAISELARECIESFAHTTTVANENPEVATRVAALFRKRSGAKPILTLDDLCDDYEQFRVWSRNLGVFAHDHSSLDFRLSTADDIRDGIASLLRSLNADLQICANLFEKDRPAPMEQEQSSSDSSSSSSCDATGLEDAVDHLLQSTAHELQIRFRRISGIIDKLFRLAEAIRASGIRNRTTKAAGYTHFQDGVDFTEQFESMYLPELLQRRFKLESPLLERFVRALSLRRKRFMFQARHQKRLAYGGDFPTTSTPSARPHMLVRSDSEPHISREERPVTDRAFVALSDIHPPTKATTFEILPPRKPAPSRIVSGTTKSDINGTEIPPPPFVTDRATHFQCPYCYILIPKEKRAPKLWKDHVIGDLQPFICLEPDFLTPDAIFDSQVEWIEHQKWEHAMRWWCDQERIGHPPLEFSTAEEYGQHLRTSHNSMNSLCSIEKQILTAGRPSVTPFSCCPLCDFLPEDNGLADLNPTHDKLTQAICSQKQLQKHIADELLAIFMFALPDRDDFQDVKTETDRPVSRNDTVLALSEVSLQFDDEIAAQNTWREITPALSIPYVDYETAKFLGWKEIPSPLSLPYAGYENWNFLWTSPQLQDGVRESYVDMQHDQILISISAHQDVVEIPRAESQLHTTNREQSLILVQRQRCLESLRNHRFQTSLDLIKTANADTCEWLLRTPEYIQWFNPGPVTSLLLSGKPGTGKSTLMKFAYIESLQDTAVNATTAYFFDSNDKYLQHPTVAMYQSIIYQIIQQIPMLSSSLEVLLPEIAEATPIKWRVESLQSVLLQMAGSSTPHRIVCYIDALDTCNTHIICDTVSFLQTLFLRASLNGTWFKFCLSIRSTATAEFFRFPRVNLDHHDGVSESLIRYTARHLKYGADNTEIVEKARNNFLWATLAIQLLNKAYDGGKGIEELRSMLQHLPIGLDKLYVDILMRHATDDKLEFCLQIVKFVKRPLSVSELRSMLQVLDQQAQNHPVENDHAYIPNISGGLLKVHPSFGTVMLIHESVAKLRMPADDSHTSSVLSRNMLLSHGHIFLKHCCEVYIRVVAYELLAENSFESKMALYNRYPSLEYVVSNIFYHYDAALREDRSLSDNMFENFPQLEWIETNDCLRIILNRPYKPYKSLLYILADQCRPRLIRLELSRTVERTTTQDRWGLACLEAITPPNVQALNNFMLAFPRRGGERKWVDDQQIERFNRAIERSHNSQKDLEGEFLHWAISYHALAALETLLQRWPGGINYRTSDGLTPLLRATEMGLCVIVELLFAQIDIDANAKNTAGLTSLAIAAKAGSTEITTFLLREPLVNVNTSDPSGRTPLLHAVWEGHIEIVKLLLMHTHIDVDVEDDRQETALIYACARGFDEVFALLKTISKLPPLSKMETLMFQAASVGNLNMARLLLDLSKAEVVHARDINGLSPLSIAAQKRNADVVELLLAHMDSASINSLDKFGLTALAWAARSDDVETARLWIERGIKDVNLGNHSNKDPLVIATNLGNHRVAEYLQQYLIASASVSHVDTRMPEAS